MQHRTAHRSLPDKPLRAVRRTLPGCLVLSLAAASASAAGPSPPWDVAQTALCTAAIEEADRHHHFPPGLLATIARVESGRPVTGDVRAWPWAVNADGASLFFDNREQAVAWARQGLAGGVRLLDVGCMQVNLQYHPSAFASLEQAFDPATNVAYAARFLEQLGAEANGDWSVATGFYHSRTPERAAAYRGRVAEMGASVLSGTGFVAPLDQSALFQGMPHRPPGTGLLAVYSRRRQGGHPWRLRSPCEMADVFAELLHSSPRDKGCDVASR